MAARPSPITTLLAAVVLACALYIGFIPVNGAPSLGAFLDPAHGVWAVATRANLPEKQSARIPGLRAAVEVLGSVVCSSGGVASAGVVVFSSVFIRASRILRVPYREL